MTFNLFAEYTASICNMYSSLFRACRFQFLFSIVFLNSSQPHSCIMSQLKESEGKLDLVYVCCTFEKKMAIMEFCMVKLFFMY